MSEIKVNSIKGVGASTAAITVNNTDGTCTANITNNLSNRNLIINGAMQVAQRGTSSTTTGYQTVDRFACNFDNISNSPTQAQVDVASGTGPYNSGFRKAFKITNGDQTIGADDRLRIQHILEAQDVANSGWNYTSTSSYITLSFWVKSSVAQNFFVRLQATDGTSQNYVVETGSLSADTWTKITKTIPGNSNLQFDNNNDSGLVIDFGPFYGTNFTGTRPLNAWAAYDGAARFPDFPTTWFDTNNATFEITGVQLEVDHTGSGVATDFEHRSFGQELALCQRYYYLMAPKTAEAAVSETINFDTQDQCFIRFPVEMRATPSLEVSNFSNAFRVYGSGGGRNVSTVTSNTGSNSTKLMHITVSGGSSGDLAFLRIYAANSGVYATLAATAEL